MPFNKAVRIKYVGTNYCGWQCQDHSVTIQEELQKALEILYKEPVHAVGSGRTDSGVHSLGQVANFRTSMYLSDEAVIFGLNSILPEDISIKEAWDVPYEFNAQTSAKNKTYLYKIHFSRVRDAFYTDRAWWVRGRADFSLAPSLLSVFEGTHDFESCCAIESLRENNVRTINYTKFYQEGELFCLEINGNGFLHNMVRIITGTVVAGCKKGWKPDRIKQMLESKDRTMGGPTAPAEGLYLKEVIYKF